MAFKKLLLGFLLVCLEFLLKRVTSCQRFLKMFVEISVIVARHCAILSYIGCIMQLFRLYMKTSGKTAVF